MNIASGNENEMNAQPQNSSCVILPTYNNTVFTSYNQNSMALIITNILDLISHMFNHLGTANSN